MKDLPARCGTSRFPSMGSRPSALYLRIQFRCGLDNTVSIQAGLNKGRNRAYGLAEASAPDEPTYSVFLRASKNGHRILSLALSDRVYCVALVASANEGGIVWEIPMALAEGLEAGELVRFQGEIPYFSFVTSASHWPQLQAVLKEERL